MELIKQEGNQIFLKGAFTDKAIVETELPALYDLLKNFNIIPSVIVLYASSGIVVNSLIDYIKQLDTQVSLVICTQYNDNAVDVMQGTHEILAIKPPRFRAKACLVRAVQGQEVVNSLVISHVLDLNKVSPLPPSYDYVESVQEVKESLSRDLHTFIDGPIVDINMNLDYLPHHKVIKCSFNNNV